MKKALLEHYKKRYELVIVEKDGKVVSIKYPRNGKLLEMKEISHDYWRVKGENFVFSFTL